MSYVRWSSPGHPWNYESDLYIYDDVAGGITCVCELNNNTPSGFNCKTREEMIVHVKCHMKLGDSVPEFVIPRLQEGRNFN